MKKELPEIISIDAAVALMVNMDYIPEGFSLSEMLLAFQEEAEIEYENALSDKLSSEDINSFRLRLDACKTRVSLADSLVQALRNDLNNPGNGFSDQQIRRTDLSEWAADKYGIGIPDILEGAIVKDEPIINWCDVTIKIRANNKISYSYEKGKYIDSYLSSIGLFNKNTQQLNNQGMILLGLCKGNNFPKATALLPKHKAAISKLRKALKTLTGIKKDPFIKYNRTAGWKPYFKLVDDRRNADERAKRAAQHTSYQDDYAHGEAHDFKKEDDEAATFIEG